MPEKIIVTPDGKEHHFPDEATEAMISEVLNGPQKSTWENIKGGLKKLPEQTYDVTKNIGILGQGGYQPSQSDLDREKEWNIPGENGIQRLGRHIYSDVKNTVSNIGNTFSHPAESFEADPNGTMQVLGGAAQGAYGLTRGAPMSVAKGAGGGLVDAAKTLNPYQVLKSGAYGGIIGRELAGGEGSAIGSALGAGAYAGPTLFKGMIQGGKEGLANFRGERVMPEYKPFEVNSDIKKLTSYGGPADPRAGMPTGKNPVKPPPSWRKNTSDIPDPGVEEFEKFKVKPGVKISMGKYTPDVNAQGNGVGGTNSSYKPPSWRGEDNLVPESTPEIPSPEKFKVKPGIKRSMGRYAPDVNGPGNGVSGINRSLRKKPTVEVKLPSEAEESLPEVEHGKADPSISAYLNSETTGLQPNQAADTLSKVSREAKSTRFGRELFKKGVTFEEANANKGNARFWREHTKDMPSSPTGRPEDIPSLSTVEGILNNLKAFEKYSKKP